MFLQTAVGGILSTVTVAGVELAVLQTPLWTTALNRVVWVNGPEVNVLAVLEISVQVVNGLTEYCHFTTAPV